MPKLIDICESLYYDVAILYFRNPYDADSAASILHGSKLLKGSLVKLNKSTDRIIFNDISRDMYLKAIQLLSANNIRFDQETPETSVPVGTSVRSGFTNNVNRAQYKYRVAK